MIPTIHYKCCLTNGLNGVRVQVTVFIRPTSEESTVSDEPHQALWKSLFFYSS